MTQELTLWPTIIDDEERTSKRRKVQEENNHMATTKSLPFRLLHEEKNPSKTPVELNLIQTLMLPWKLKRRIDEIEGHSIKLIMQKKLYNSDLNSSLSRLSIPENTIKEEAIDFLEKEEEELLKSRSGNRKLKGLPVLVVDSNLREYNLVLKKWPMKTSSVYNLTSGWNAIVTANELKQNDTVQLWSFRKLNNNQLCFAFVKL